MSEGLTTYDDTELDDPSGAYDLDGPDDVDEYDDPDDEYDEDEYDDLDDEDEDDEEEGDDLGGDLDEAEADEIVLDLLDRARAGELLDREQISDLGLLLGDRRAGAALGGRLNQEAHQRRARPRKRGFWHWAFGPIHEQGDPIPNGVAAVLLRIQEGRPLDGQDFKRLGAVIGRRAVRAFEAVVHGAVERDDRPRGRGRGGRR